MNVHQNHVGLVKAGQVEGLYPCPGMTNRFQAITGLPLFLGANEYALRQTFAHGQFDPLEPGDVVYMNVPYWSGAHTNDGVLTAPVFVDGEIVAYTVVRAHWKVRNVLERVR